MGKGLWPRNWDGAGPRAWENNSTTPRSSIAKTGRRATLLAAVFLLGGMLASGHVWAGTAGAAVVALPGARGAAQDASNSALPPLPDLPSLPQRTSTGDPLPTEARGTWVVRGGWLADESSIDWIVLQHVLNNMNSVFVQVNGRGEAFYNSRIVPKADEVVPGFDPLAELVDKAHEAGLEVHAWINAYTVGAIGKLPDNGRQRHILNQHPEWITYDYNGVSVLDYDWSQPLSSQIVAPTLDPGVPGVNDYVASIYLEVVEEYDVDGIHFDYVRYPYRAFGYHPAALAQFEREHGLDPMELQTRRDELVAQYGEERVVSWQEEWDEWRRDRVTDLVRRVYRGIKAIRPDVQVSAAVVADIDQAVNARLQDWPAWLAEGILDFVVPMAYSENPDTVHSQIAAAVQRAGDRHVYAGIGAYKVSADPDDVVALIDAARSAGSDGVVLFSFNWEPTSFRYWGEIRRKAFPEPSRPPSISRMEDSAR